MINEALAKAAEEQTGGLAMDAPLHATPASRRNAGTVERMDAYGELVRSMALRSREMVMIPLRIGTAWRIQDNPARLKSAMRAYGLTAGMPCDEAMAHAGDLMADYEAWRSWMARYNMQTIRDVTISICAQGLSYTEAGIRCMASRTTAKRYAEQGCFEYHEANRRERTGPGKVEAPHDPQPLRITRVVIFDQA